MGAKPIVHAWIFARGGSKGVPRKNIRPLCGKPLIAYAIELAKKSKYSSEVFVSTDDREIADTAARYGAKVPFMRPSELAQDKSPERLAWRHAVNWNRSQTQYPKMDIMVSLPATAPLRTVEEVDQAIELYMQGSADTVIAVSPSAHHPAFNMVYLDERNQAEIIMSKYVQWVSNRQSYPKAYNITTAVYVTSPDYVLTEDVYTRGRVKSIIIPEEDGVDIDTLLDFKIAELIMKERKGE